MVYAYGHDGCRDAMDCQFARGRPEPFLAEDRRRAFCNGERKEGLEPEERTQFGRWQNTRESRPGRGIREFYG